MERNRNTWYHKVAITGFPDRLDMGLRVGRKLKKKGGEREVELDNLKKYKLLKPN